MSVTIDANVLIYAANPADPAHDEAIALLNRLTRGPGPLTLLWPTLLAFVRITTNPRVFPAPFTMSEATAKVDALLEHHNVRVAGETDDFWPTLRSVLGQGVRGPLASDAHLVALMLVHGVRTMYTRDRDFRRFDGIEAVDPFA